MDQQIKEYLRELSSSSGRESSPKKSRNCHVPPDPVIEFIQHYVDMMDKPAEPINLKWKLKDYAKSTKMMEKLINIKNQLEQFGENDRDSKQEMVRDAKEDMRKNPLMTKQLEKWLHVMCLELNETKPLYTEYLTEFCKEYKIEGGITALEKEILDLGHDTSSEQNEPIHDIDPLQKENMFLEKLTKDSKDIIDTKLTIEELKKQCTKVTDQHAECEKILMHKLCDVSEEQMELMTMRQNFRAQYNDLRLTTSIEKLSGYPLAQLDEGQDELKQILRAFISIMDKLKVPTVI